MTKYGSDLIVDLLQQYDIPYVALNPGASFRGLHDSIVNYGGNKPEIIECPHEEIAVQIAQGYAKATGRPMAAILHNVVGLLHSNLAIYYSYLDRVPMLILGATGPMAVSRRRPQIDWDHTALVQGNAIREYVKWDDQPFDLQGIVHSFAKGYRIASTEPQGPVYICYDVALQEDPLSEGLELPASDKARLHSRVGCEREALKKTLELLLRAENPVIIVDLMGRNPARVETLVNLAELLAAPVIDLNGRFNFPNNHPLAINDRNILKQADVVLAIDVRDLYGCLTVTDADRRPTGNKYISPSCQVIEISLNELEITGWAQNFQCFQPTDLSILADSFIALPELLDILRLQEKNATTQSSIANREGQMKKWRAAHEGLKKRWQEQARQGWDNVPMTPARMAHEIGEIIEEYDWVLTANTANNWARKLWDFDKPYRHPGKSLGTATQIGISLGVALAYKGTNKLVVDIQPDGDLMYDPGALWVAAHHQIPMLVVMYNNRCYGNSWNHQAWTAKHRMRSDKNNSIGVELDNPAPDFAALARSFGWYAEGPVLEGKDLSAALQRAVRVVTEEKRPALVDAVTGIEQYNL